MFELKKDISTPADYYRAGEQKTKEEWNTLFPGCFDFHSNEWFIDVEEAKKESLSADKQISDIIFEVFEGLQLYSISYKMATRRCIKKYIELQKSKEK